MLDSLPNTYNSWEALELARQHEKNKCGVDPLTVARTAEQAGAQVTWFGSNDALAHDHDRRVLISGHACTDSALGSALVGDEHLAKQLLNQTETGTNHE